MIKKVISVCTAVLMLVLSLNVSALAKISDSNKEVNNPKFKSEAQAQIHQIQKLIKNGSIVVNNNLYVIVNDTNLSTDKLDTLNYYLSIFNEGLSMGIFQMTSDNGLEKSIAFIQKQDENSKRVVNDLKAQLPQDNGIRPYSIGIEDLDAIFNANANYMFRDLYINMASYGPDLGRIQTGFDFAHLVGINCPWDYKTQLGWNTRYTVTVNHTTMLITGEQIGNSNYGFAGRKAFSAELLRTAAGAVQIYSSGLNPAWYSTYFDQPDDQNWINRGITYSEGGTF